MELVMSNSWISKAARLAIYNRDNWTCCYCGKKCCHYNDRTNNYDYATLDHIVSRIDLALVHSGKEFRNALRDARNLVTVCNQCNTSKQEVSLYVWSTQKGYDYYAIRARIVYRTA